VLAPLSYPVLSTARPTHESPEPDCKEPRHWVEWNIAAWALWVMVGRAHLPRGGVEAAAGGGGREACDCSCQHLYVCQYRRRSEAVLRVSCTLLCLCGCGCSCLQSVALHLQTKVACVPQASTKIEFLPADSSFPGLCTTPLLATPRPLDNNTCQLTPMDTEPHEPGSASHTLRLSTSGEQRVSCKHNLTHVACLCSPCI
jgi:hypothetical protein